MRPAASLAILALLAACSGAGPPPPTTEQTSASFIAGGVANVISVDATDRLALRQAELIAPDGSATAASSVTASPAPTQNFSGQFPASPYAGAQFGVSSIGSNALSPGYVGMGGAAVANPAAGDRLDRLDPGARSGRLSA